MTEARLTPAGSSPLPRAHLEEAADWWARMQDEDTAQTDISAWLDWLESRPANREAFERIQELTLRLEATRRPPRRLFTAPVAIAASAALVAIGTLMFATGKGLGSRPTLSIATPVATSIERPLPDGSTVSVGGASALEASYTQESRVLELKEGEAYFQVKPDRGTRPFVVEAGPISIRALGTAFNVRKTRQRVTVTVTEGRVQVGRTGNSSAGVEVAAGEQALYDPAANRFRVSAVDATRSLSWRDQRLEFMDEPLDSVIDNVNRYSPKKIEVRGIDLHGHSYTGTFQPNTVDDWLVAISRAFPVRVEEHGDIILLEPRR